MHMIWSQTKGREDRLPNKTANKSLIFSWKHSLNSFVAYNMQWMVLCWHLAANQPSPSTSKLLARSAAAINGRHTELQIFTWSTPNNWASWPKKVSGSETAPLWKMGRRNQSLITEAEAVAWHFRPSRRCCHGLWQSRKAPQRNKRKDKLPIWPSCSWQLLQFFHHFWTQSQALPPASARHHEEQEQPSEINGWWSSAAAAIKINWVYWLGCWGHYFLFFNE